MDQSPPPVPVSKRRKFRIQSEFGRPRQWRSRKSRPCDTCRRRKTACIIDTQPPCRFCRIKGLDCQATTGPEDLKSASEETVDQRDEEIVDVLIVQHPRPPPPAPTEEVSPRAGGASLYASEPGAALSPATELSSGNTSSPAWTVLHDDRPLVAHLAGSYSDEPMMGADATASTGRTASFSGGGGAPSALLAPPSNTTAAAATAANTTVQTLEDGVGLTAHSMGLSAEQDTELLASFRSAVINETNNVDADIVQVCAGDRTGHRPPVHFSVLRDDFDPFDNIAKNAASDRIEAAVAGHADTLVRLYFRHVHPVYPVVSKTRFLRAYARDKTSIPASLRGAIYGLASNFWAHARSNHAAAATVPASSPSSSSAAAAAAHSPLSCSSRLSSTHTQQRGFNQHELFEDALGSLQREFHGPNLWVLQASLLLIHETPADNATIESPRVWMLASQAVACAQMIGLHRDPTDWAIAPWEKALRRKLWWATFATDVWSSVSHGNPPHIYPASFTTPALSMDDLSFDEDVPPDLHYLVDATSAHLDVSACARFFEGITVARLVHNLLLSSFLDVTYEESMQDPPAREKALLAVRTKLHNWERLLPRCVTMNGPPRSDARLNNAPVHLSFYAAVALLFRALMSPVTKAAKSDRNSSLRRYFQDAVEDFAPFADFMDEITPECLHAFWGLHARSQLILCGNFLIYLFLLAPDPSQVQDTFRLLGRFHDSLQRLSAVADKVAIHILRPVALRIDSFFTQAAQIMRVGSALPQQQHQHQQHQPPPPSSCSGQSPSTATVTGGSGD